MVDDWECERDNVEMGAELGKGSFGMVYKGYFKDPKQVVLNISKTILYSLRRRGVPWFTVL